MIYKKGIYQFKEDYQIPFKEKIITFKKDSCVKVDYAFNKQLVTDIILDNVKYMVYIPFENLIFKREV